MSEITPLAKCQFCGGMQKTETYDESFFKRIHAECELTALRRLTDDLIAKWSLNEDPRLAELIARARVLREGKKT